MNSGLSKLGTALTVVFAAILAALVAQLFFLIWRRPKSQSQTRIEHHKNPPHSQHHSSVDVDVDEVFKWQHALYGVSSRVLFTIEEEEERRGLDSAETTTHSSCAEKEVKTATTVLLDVAVMVMSVEVDDGMTSFLTPCASPPYYTLSSSPGRETCSV
ncbi:PREDICTED: LOC110622290 [Prunus dulcis]|uniref:PREDICTED: LOC110622290 n=1 Tax=Prunus dulcis TaxID=3755 RepID=A0A5E4E9A2_PRUDU|nr:PREDICTED: LOC110622290 [Prunus dulcis]